MRLKRIQSGSAAVPLTFQQCMQRNGKGRAGITLIDCLVYIGLLAVLMSLAFSAFYTVSDHSKHLSRNAADIARALNAGERWRSDVRSAIGLPQLVDADDGSVLLLRQKIGEIQYSYRDGMIYRRTTGKANESWQLMLDGVKSSTMREKRYTQAAVWRWEIELQADQKAARVKPLFSFQAVIAFHPVL